MLPHIDGEVLNDKVVIIHPSGSVGEPEIFEPYTRVCLPDVLGDVGGLSEALWERCSPDAPAKGPWSRAIRAWTPVIWPATMPGVCFTAPLDGLARVCLTRPYYCPMDVIILSGLMPVADDAASILVWSESFAHRGAVWSGR